MAGSCKPGPLDFSDGRQTIDAGTLCRNVSPAPGHICFMKPVEFPRPQGPKGARGPLPSIPVLRLNDRGPNVKKLQAFLNFQMPSAPSLKVDGNFGPLTQGAVLQFQASRSIKVDGVVGKITWSRLVQGTPAAATQPKAVLPKLIAQRPAAATSPKDAATRQKFESILNRAQALKPAQPTAPPWHPPANSVMDWSLKEKFEYVVDRVPAHLPGAVRNQFIGLVSPLSIVIILAAAAASMWFGAGELIFVGMMVLLGEQAVFDLAHTIQITYLAASETELNEAAGYLADAFITAGVATLMVGLKKLPGKFSDVDKPAGGPETPNVEKPAGAATPGAPTGFKPPVADVGALLQQMGNMLMNGQDPMKLLVELSKTAEGRQLINSAHIAASGIMVQEGGSMPPEVFRMFQNIQGLTSHF
jgi:hypothetical protein